VASPSELRLIQDDKTTPYGNEAMVSDFPALSDDATVYVTLGADEAVCE
jgi:hypothetical protein